MIVMVDGWIRRVPEGAEFIEFRSSHESGHAGDATAYDADGTEMEMESLGLTPEPAHWTQRVKETL